jgi:hypothetical protein
MSSTPSAPGLMPGAVVSSDGAGAPERPAHRSVSDKSRIRDGSLRPAGIGRWVAFILLSIALHASFLLSRPAGMSVAALSQVSDGAPTVMRLLDGEIGRSRPPNIESEWKPLEPLALQRLRKPRMVEFVPINLPPAQFDEDLYLPVSRVTLRPSPRARVAVPYPPGVAVAGSASAKVVVFIDDDGSVAKVDLAKDQAATPFAMAAKTTFEHLRYRPALLDGKPVKVRVIVEVTFEDREAKS